MKTGRGIRVTPIGHIDGTIEQDGAGYHDDTSVEKFQSLDLLVVLKTAAMSRIVPILALTDASVKATSTAPISAHMRHMKKL